jgi:hypothetical protein
MIKINAAKKEVCFIPKEGDEAHPMARRLPLLSAYVCLFCNRILVAYFQGSMPEAEIAYYRNEKPRYAFGSVAGGHYLKLESHQSSYNDSERCAWELFGRRGIAENLRLFVRQYEIPLLLVKMLAEKIDSLPGFCVVQDVCGRDREMLLFSEDRFLEQVRREEGFDAYWKAKMNLGEHIRKTLTMPQKLF